MRTTNFLLICSFLVFVACGQHTDFIPNPPPPIPGCVPVPLAESQDLNLVLGLGMPKSLQIGGPAVAGSQYMWDAEMSLDRLDLAEPTASPQKTTVYHETVTNKCGSVRADVTVHVYAESINEE